MKIAKYKGKYILATQNRYFDKTKKEWDEWTEYVVTSLIPLPPMITLLISIIIVIFLKIILTLHYPSFLALVIFFEVFIYLFLIGLVLIEPVFYEETTAKKYIDGLKTMNKIKELKEFFIFKIIIGEYPKTISFFCGMYFMFVINLLIESTYNLNPIITLLSTLLILYLTIKLIGKLTKWDEENE
jgi:hypothetical protein